MSIVLVDARSDSLTVSWPAITGADYYLLEFRTDDADWELLADDLVQPMARKHNLLSNVPYYFRAAPIYRNDKIGQWMIHRQGYCTLDMDEEEYCMAPPLTETCASATLMITWEHVEEAFFYELQMRENRGGAAWQTVGDEVQGTEVRKRNLTSTYGYQFRVRPVTEEEEPWSAPSGAAVAVHKNGTKKNRSATRASNAGKTPHSQTKPPPQHQQHQHHQQQRDPNAMPAPWIKNAGIKNAVLVCWQAVPGASGYELQMKENNGKDGWSTVASNLGGTEVRKKNLVSYFGYLFRVRPHGVGSNKPFSAPSNIAIAT